MPGTLIIYAHPKHQGHSARILEQVRHELVLREEQFEIVDLYALKYDPVLHANEHYTSGGRDIAKENKALQEKIAKAERLVFVFPVWWGSMPAILKGFFDRVLTSRFAYRYVKMPFPLLGLRYRPVGLLKGKRAAVFMTVGSPRWVHALFTRNAQQFVLRRNILGFCGIRSRIYTLDNCGTPLDGKKEKRIKRMVSKGLRRLF